MKSKDGGHGKMSLEGYPCIRRSQKAIVSPPQLIQHLSQQGKM